MRDVLRGLGCPDHIGLAYDVWAPVKPGFGNGKVPDDERAGWLDALCDKEVPQDYRDFFERWRAALRPARLMEITLGSRLLLGHGNPSATEVGLTVHRTWGVPVIPGSALKGLLNHFIEAAFGPQPGVEDPEREKYRGVTWNGNRIARGPGAVHRALFGAPESDEADAGSTAGVLVFHDALFLPEDTPAGRRPFAPDVLTVHQAGYYQGRGWSNDFESPTPVSFLSVRPGVRFLVAIEGDPEWAGLAIELLKKALLEWGVGGKTSAGYGRVRECKIHPRAATGLLAEFLAFVDSHGGSQKEVAQSIAAAWAGRLATLGDEEREAACKAIRKALKSPKLKDEVEGLCGRILG